MDTRADTEPRRERRVQWSTIVVAAVFCAACLVPVALWFGDHQSRFADAVVLDHTPAGQPIGQAAAGTVIILSAAVTVLASLLAALSSSRVRADLSWRHACAATSLAIPVVAVGTLAAVLAPQLDVPSAGQAGSGHILLALALVGSLFAGALGALLVRPAAARPHEIAADGRRSWSGRGAGVPLTTFLWPIGTALVAVMVALGQPSHAVGLAVWCVAVVLLLLRIRGSHPHIEIDERGVRMLLGHRLRAHARLADVLEVDVVHARPLRDFGGWGLRIGRGGNVGWVTRRGPALHVRRHFAGDMVITLDDPYQAAAVARTLLAERNDVTAGNRNSAADGAR